MPAPFLDRFIKLRAGEATTAWLMFAYSFLAMTSYNIVKPLTKSQFIDRLGADNTPYVLLAAVFIIGVVMQVYSRASRWMPGRAIVPATLGGLAGLLVAFWLLFLSGAVWVSVAFYVFGLMFGILTISQFWTIANHIYDSRQARRLFGFIGGGASLGGAMGNGITGWFQAGIGKNNLLLVSAGVLGLCIVIVTTILRRQPVAADFAAATDERGVGGGEALRLLRESRHLKIIALVIGFAALGATIVDWQVNMTAEQSGDVSSFLARVGFYVSIVGFVVQVGLTNVIHRSLGLAVALLVLPFGLGATALVILSTGLLWAPAAGSVYDRSLRYSLDKTTREVLFLPLPSDLKQRAKPFVDVTVDRLGKAFGSLLLLALNKPWGLGLTWQHVSYASLVVMGLWIVATVVARREYLRSFRRSLGTHDIEPSGVRVSVADAATIEALVEELAHPDEALGALRDRHARVARPAAPDHAAAPASRVLEGAGARAARARIGAGRSRRALDSGGAPHAEGSRRGRPRGRDPRAGEAHRRAGARADAPVPRGRRPARRGHGRDRAGRFPESGRSAGGASPRCPRSPGDDRALAAAGRREAAAALARIRNPDCRALLLPLLHDRDVDVAREAIASARAAGRGDARFVPALVSLLGHRVLKAPARAALVGFGEDVIDALAYFLKDQGEHVWVRRHVPATLAALPCQASMTALVGALGDPDGFLRYKIIEAIEAMRRAHPELALPPGVIDALVLTETTRYYNYLTLRFNVVQRDHQGAQSLVVRALDDKLARTLDRIYRLLGLIYPWQDIVAARQSLERGDARTRAHAREYLDNVLAGPIRRRVMPIIDDQPAAEKVRVANEILRTRPRDLEDTLAQLIHEPDPVVAASAIEFVESRQLWSLADDLEFVARPAPVRSLRDRHGRLGAVGAPASGDRPHGDIGRAVARRRAGRSAACDPPLRLRVGGRAVSHRDDRAVRCATRPDTRCTNKARSRTTCSSSSTAPFA